MTAGSWLCLLAPLVGTILILLGGSWLPRVAAAWIATTSVFVAFGGAVWAFFGVRSSAGHQGEITTAWTWLQSGHFSVGLQLLVDPLSTMMMLIGGGVAKSAQIPLQTWLPDAMEGPTPVSALIHAATMVTAGVYLIARTHPIFEQASTIALLAAGNGALTLIVAGLIALVQTDIKRVIAYSTMSQIGYMFMAVGVGAFSNGMFHLMTHAFFKALLFMTAGLVIHAIADEQDIRKLRGVGAMMPWTKWAFLVGAAALVGVPAFSGFFSKDPILAADLHDHWYGVLFAVCGLVGTFLTGLYTFRLYFIVFPGEPSAFVREHHHRHHGREGPWTMLVPVAILTVLAAVSRWIQVQPFWDPITHWLSSVVPTEPAAEATNWDDAVMSVLAPILGIGGVVVRRPVF